MKTKAQVIANKSYGIKHFDKAVSTSSRQKILEDTVSISAKHPYIWKRGWSNVHWAFINAVGNIVSPNRDICQSYNLDEVLSEDEITWLANSLNITDTYESIWKRK